MGYFTWTDARKEPKILKNGDYASADKINYGGYAKIVCPDNTEIVETYYEGYGIFGDKDVYDLVVDWNKNHLESIFNNLLSKDPAHWGAHLKNLAVFYQNDDTAKLEAEINRLVSTGKEMPFFKEEWKRTIGITIACGEEENKALPFPIKITSTKWKKTYDELHPSYYCQ